MLHTKNSKIKSLFKISILIVFLSSLIFTLVVTKKELYKTNYKVGYNEIIGTITSIKKTDYGLKIEMVAKEKLVFNYYEELSLKVGDIVKVKGILKRPNKNTIFNLFNYQNYLLSNKIYYQIEVEQLNKIGTNNNLIYKLKAKTLSYIDKFDNKDYILTLVIGDRSLLDSEVYENYKNIGVCHLFAISGMHISLFSGFLLFLFKTLFKKEIISYLLTIIILLFYLLIASISPSILRAVFLFILLAINKFSKLKLESIYVLILLASLFLFLNPYYIYNIGFIFSFVVTFFLMLFKPSSKNYFISLFKVSLISTLVSIPILINTSFEINVMSILANLIFVPYVSLIVFPITIFALFVPYLDFILSFLVDILEHLSVFFNYISIIIPFKKISSYYIILYYLIIILVIKKPKYFYVLLILMIVHYNINYLERDSYLTMLDVGQGDSFLITLPHNQGNIMIDTGGSLLSNYSIALNKTIPYLKSLGIHELDYLILTHGDADHAKEANTLIKNFKVKKVLTNSGSNTEYEKINATRVSNYKLKLNNYTFKIMNQKNIKNENKDSLIIYTNIDGVNILLMGDADTSNEEHLLSNYKLPKIDILKVGHHGSRTSTSEYFIKKIKPKIGLISVGLNNIYNHPNIEVINLLNNNHVLTYLTSINGSVRIKISRKLTIYTIN